MEEADVPVKALAFTLSAFSLPLHNLLSIIPVTWTVTEVFSPRAQRPKPHNFLSEVTVFLDLGSSVDVCDVTESSKPVLN